MFGGLQRTYVVHVPARLEHPNGLVLNLHGGSQTGRKQSAETNYDAIADQYGWVVAIPTVSTSVGPTGAAQRPPDRQGGSMTSASWQR